jgi:hypothetical protein
MSPVEHEDIDSSLAYRLGVLEANIKTLCDTVKALNETVKKNNRDIANAVVAVKVAKWFLLAGIAFVTFKWTTIKFLWASL